MIACGYSLYLYCDNGRVSGGTGCPRDETHLLTQGVAEFDGQDRADTFRQAREAGWLADRKNDRCLCPKCRAQAKGKTPAPAARPAAARDPDHDGRR